MLMNEKMTRQKSQQLNIWVSPQFSFQWNETLKYSRIPPYCGNYSKKYFICCSVFRNWLEFLLCLIAGIFGQIFEELIPTISSGMFQDKKKFHFSLRFIIWCNICIVCEESKPVNVIKFVSFVTPSKMKFKNIYKMSKSNSKRT